jgi:hypothetical protein
MGGSALGPQGVGLLQLAAISPRGLQFHARMITVGEPREGSDTSSEQRAQTEAGGPASVAFKRQDAGIGYASPARRIRLVA